MGPWALEVHTIASSRPQRRGSPPDLEAPTSVRDIPVSLSAMLRAAHDVINLEAMTEEGVHRGTVHGLPSNTS